MDQLIPIVNSLQNVLAAYDSKLLLDLPQIAVVGAQSAGKSSVLENICGRDFLPRGSGIVTRRPLLLQLVQQQDTREYGEFNHRKGERMFDFDAIRNEIQLETDRIAGSGKAVSSTPINLRLCGPNFVNLTLVDLPGLTKVPIGDQPADIESQLLELIMSYIERENCLILAVCPANADLSTSDALKLAQLVDPDGNRTIGVLTKLDLMDDGTNAKDILANTIIPLRYGYVGVVNRSQKDINGNKNVQAALIDEATFFRSHPDYAALGERVGTKNLIKLLSIHLTQHIAEMLPNFKKKLQNQLVDLEMQQQSLLLHSIDYDLNDPAWKPKAMVMLAIQFAQMYRNEMLGSSEVNLNVSSYSAGARIMNLFTSEFPRLLQEATDYADEVGLKLCSIEANSSLTYTYFLFSMTPLQQAMKRIVGVSIENIKGVRPGLFTPDKAFDRVIQTQIAQLEHPIMLLVDQVCDEVLHAVQTVISTMPADFPLFNHELKIRSDSVVYRLAETARERAKELLTYELGYINTRHEDFVGFNFAEQKAYRRVIKRRNPGAQTTCKGWLICNRKRQWFVLTLDTLCCYNDDTENERKHIIAINENLLLRDCESINRFVLIDYTGGRIYMDKHEIELETLNADDFERWIFSLLRAGIPSDRLSRSTVSKDILDEHDPWLERQIESICILTDSYMKIVCRTLLDIVPKCIVRTLIRDSIENYERSLVADIARLQNADELMTENAAVVERREQVRKALTACRLSLDQLNNIIVPTIPRPPPPPPQRSPSIPIYHRRKVPSPPVRKQSDQSHMLLTVDRANSTAIGGNNKSSFNPQYRRSKSSSRISSPSSPTENEADNGVNRSNNATVNMFRQLKAHSPFSIRSDNSKRSVRKTIDKSISIENRAQWHIDDD